jgi:hypothetical protein
MNASKRGLTTCMTGDAARCFRRASGVADYQAFPSQTVARARQGWEAALSAGISACARPSLLPITRRDWVACRRQARGAGSVDPQPTVTIRVVACRSASVRTSGLLPGSGSENEDGEPGDAQHARNAGRDDPECVQLQPPCASRSLFPQVASANVESVLSAGRHRCSRINSP